MTSSKVEKTCSKLGTMMQPYLLLAVALPALTLAGILILLPIEMVLLRRYYNGKTTTSWGPNAIMSTSLQVASISDFVLAALGVSQAPPGPLTIDAECVFFVFLHSI